METQLVRQRSSLVRALHVLARLIPGDYARTFIYLNLVMRVRKAVYLALNSFYRMDHVYEVLNEFKHNYHGKFSVLEFGVADGYSFTKKLYAIKYLNMEDRVLALGFDTFTGMPERQGISDENVVSGDNWEKGDFCGNYSELLNYCVRKKYHNFKLIKGLFSDTVNEEIVNLIREYRPILIWIDSDYYSSARDALVPLLQYLPSGDLF
jgi:hypothetical protein